MTKQFTLSHKLLLTTGALLVIFGFTKLLQAEPITTTPPENLPQSVKRWWNIIVKYAKQYGVDPKAIATIIKVESNGNPSIIGSYGEIGLMQVLPQTANSLGYDYTLLYNPEWNIKIGTEYFAMQYYKYKDFYKAFYSYNGGYYPRADKPSAHKNATNYANKCITIYSTL